METYQVVKTLSVEKPKPLLSRIKRGLLFALGILIVLVAASFFTTVVYSSAELPSGTYRLHVRNAAGSPVEGAILNIYVRDAPAQPYNYSDAQGVMEFDKGVGLGQGPTHDMGWMLFWIFPITPSEDSRVNFEITAQGYEPLRFPETDLYKFVLLNHRHAPKTKAETYNGIEVDVNLYELDFTLQEKK
jgi:hypothetical protein